jgi:hypothetical protein
MRSECYKSDLRHALSFAAIWQNCGCAGKGFPAVARVSFPFRIRDSGFVLANSGSKRSHHRARPASAWRVPLPYSKSRPVAAMMLPQKKGEYSGIFARNSCAATQTVRLCAQFIIDFYSGGSVHANLATKCLVQL